MSERFAEDFHQRVHGWFDAQGLAPHGGLQGVLTTLGLLGGMVLLHGVALSNRVHGPGFFAVQLALGALCYLYAMTVAHEATHGTLSGWPAFDRMALRLFDLIVLSSFVWQHDHLRVHHAALNVVGRDNAVEGAGLFRFHADQPRRPWHAYQHLYAWAVYGAASMHRWFLNDWLRLARITSGPDPVPMPPGEKLWFATGVVVRNALFLGLPPLLTDVPFAQVAAGFVVMHLCLSVPLVLSVQLSHLFDGTRMFRERAPNAAEVVEVTLDFAPESRWVGWWTGGHNLHTVHHLVDHVHHRHFRPLHRILVACAREHGVQRRLVPSPWGAVAAHYRYLRSLGRP